MPADKNSLPTPALFRQAQAGDRGARDALFAQHERLIWHVLHRYGIGEFARNREDLYQVGAIGLLKAIQRFDPGQGWRFATYAIPLILGEMRRDLRDNQAIHMGRTLSELASRAIRIRDHLRQQLNREPTVKEMAEGLGVDVAAIVEALDARLPPLSLETGGGGETSESDTLIDRIKGDEPEAAWVDRLSLAEALTRLSDRQRWILAERFDDGATQAQLAIRLGISQVQVSRLERQALERLRQELVAPPPRL